MENRDRFSQREREVIDLLMEGRSNKQMALKLGLSVRTVEFHLGQVYSKLGVNSRTEAALKLAGKGLWKSANDGNDDELREPAIEKDGKLGENGTKPFSNRRFPMRKMLLAVTSLLATVLVLLPIIERLPVRGAQLTSTPTPIPARLPSPAVEFDPATTTTAATSREFINEQIRLAAAEFEQNVRAEKKNGKVQTSRDPQTGAELFVFQDESYRRISDLRDALMLKITDLDGFYTRIYRDALQPTPFPAQPATEQEVTAYKAALREQGERLCSLAAWQKDPQIQSVPVYDPESGGYQEIYFGDPLARCEVYGQMLEELRTGPLMARINQQADIDMIRRVTGKPGLELTFKSIQSLANAPWLNTALYTDETGTKYYVEIESARLATIEPNFPTHPQIPAEKVKGIDELRGIAGQFALTNSPRLAELKQYLDYSEGGKTSLRFFTWTYRAKDWSGTDWVMMPPFIQVGVLQDGQVATYINTLDLYK